MFTIPVLTKPESALVGARLATLTVKLAPLAMEIDPAFTIDLHWLRRTPLQRENVPPALLVSLPGMFRVFPQLPSAGGELSGLLTLRLTWSVDPFQIDRSAIGYASR